MRQYLAICIDDDEEFLNSLRQSLPSRVEPLCEDFECHFEFVSSCEELYGVVEESAQDGLELAMVISDQLMPGMSGLDLVEKLKDDYPDTVCILLTGHAGLDSAKQAINRRLLDQYVAKPIEDMHEFSSTVSNLLKRHHLELEERERTAQLAETVEQLRVSNERIRSMHAAAEQIAMLSKGLKCVDFDEVVRLVTDEVPKLFHADWGVLCLRNALPQDSANPLVVSRHKCPAVEQFLLQRGDQANLNQQGEMIMGDVPVSCEELGGRSPSMIIPLGLGGMGGEESPTRWAYMCLCSVKAAEEVSSDLLSYKGGLVRDILSANLTNALLYSIARTQSRKDSLTGAATRRVLEEKLQAECDRSTRYGHPFCVVVADVDGFKSVNDNHGHDMGDRVLSGLADVMRGQVRSSDTLARYGGDEFVWLMPETTAEWALAAVDRLRKSIESRQAGNQPAVTISYGIAQWSGSPNDSATDVLRHADAAMYQAKRSGRDRVVVYGSPQEAATG